MRSWCVLMLAALLLVPLAQSQSSDAPHPSPEAMVLYAHGTGSDEENGFMNTLEEDGGDNALGPSSSCAPYEGVDLLADDISRTYTFALDPALVHAVLLDTAATIDVVAHLGAGGCDGDEVEITARLEQGDTVVAESDAVAHTWTGGAPYDTAELSMSPQLDRIEPGQPLVWTLDIEGTYYGQMFLGISDEQGHTRMTLPITGVDAPPEAPAVEFHDLDDAEAAITIDLNGTRAYQFNWTAPEGPLSLFMQGTVDAGSVNVTILDGIDTPLLDSSFEAQINVTQTLNGTSGAWRVLINSTDAAGDLAILIAHPADVPDNDGRGTETDDDVPDEANDATGNATDDGQDSPGLGALVVLAALFAVMAARRR